VTFLYRKYVLFTSLQRKRVQNESPVLLSISADLSRERYEQICQIFFERFNVAGFGILERPMAQIYATTALSGVVVDVDYDHTDITPIYEGFILQPGTLTTSIGINDCQRYLANLLKSNQSVMAAVSPPESPLESSVLDSTLLAFVEQIWKDGHIKIPSDGETAVVEDEGITDIAAIVVAGKEKAVIESGMKKKQSQKQSAEQQARAREIEAMDLITVQFRGHSIVLGKERHRFCEPLFDPTLVGKGDNSDTVVLYLSLQEAVARAIRQADVDHRQYIWQGVLVTGDLTKTVKGEYQV
jgi:actin-related protein 9